MINFFRNKAHLVLFFLFFISILPFFLKAFEKNTIKPVFDEQFDPRLLYLNNIDKMQFYIDSVYEANNSRIFDTALYVQTVSSVVKQRFYRDLSNYKISENWISVILGELIWPHLSAIVKPNDILMYPNGLCSQQTIVFMELLKLKNINVRSVGLGYKEGPGHFLCEVYYNNSWRLHDVTFEPKWIKASNIHESMDYYLINKDSLYLVYETRIPRNVFDKITERIEYGQLNVFPARKMLIFHNVTKTVTYILPILLLLFSILLYKNKKKNIKGM